MRGRADVTVSPARLTFTAPGQTRTFHVRIQAKVGASTGAWTTGSLTWTGPGGTVRSPVAVRPQDLGVPSSVSGSGTSGSDATTLFDFSVPADSTAPSASAPLAATSYRIRR